MVQWKTEENEVKKKTCTNTENKISSLQKNINSSIQTTGFWLNQAAVILYHAPC